MFKKILKQTAVCMLIVVSLLIADNSGIGVLQRGTEAVLNHMSVSYTADDMKTVFQKSVGAFGFMMGKTSDAINVITGKPVYGDPIDDRYEGNEASVYAVAGGKVIASGENEEIGKYVKILHGDQAESLYGNLKTVNVSVPDRVKKGQIIGVYERKEDKEFYYSLKEIE